MMKMRNLLMLLCAVSLSGTVLAGNKKKARTLKGDVTQAWEDAKAGASAKWNDLKEGAANAGQSLKRHYQIDNGWASVGNGELPKGARLTKTGMIRNDNDLLKKAGIAKEDAANYYIDRNGEVVAYPKVLTGYVPAIGSDVARIAAAGLLADALIRDENSLYGRGLGFVTDKLANRFPMLRNNRVAQYIAQRAWLARLLRGLGAAGLYAGIDAAAARAVGNPSMVGMLSDATVNGFNAAKNGVVNGYDAAAAYIGG